MSKRNIIFLVLFLIIISCAIGLYLYIQDKNLSSQKDSRTAEQIRQDAIRTEVNNLKLDAVNIKPEKEMIKELNSLKPQANISVKTPSTTSTPKPKTPEEILKELNSLKPPVVNPSSSVNNLNP